MGRLTKQSMDGNVETLLLAVLQDGPSYGYQIVQDLNARAAGLLAMGEGTVYPVLHRLERRELITATWRKGETGRQRKYYRLSPKGRRALRQNVRQWEQMATVMHRVLGPAGNAAGNPQAHTLLERGMT